MNDVDLALDPSRSYWQRWGSPLLLSEVSRIDREIVARGVPLSLESVLGSLILPGDAINADILTSAMVVHARARAQRCGRPLYVLDAEAAKALSETDLPDENLGALRLPHEGFYIAVPPGMFHMEDPRSGTHELEGIHVCESLVTPGMARADVVAGPAVDLVLIGRAKGSRKAWLGFEEPEDSIRFVTLGAWSEPARIFKSPVDKVSLHLVVNLLWALENGYLATERIEPPTPKSPGKIKILSRRGWGLHPYTTIRLGKKAHAARDAASTGTGGSVRAHTVRGYWNRYWVLTPDSPTYGIKTREDGKILSAVRRWIPPSVRGQGETPESKQYRVRL
jgi:hypothetical protein